MMKTCQCSVAEPRMRDQPWWNSGGWHVTTVDTWYRAVTAKLENDRKIYARLEADAKTPEDREGFANDRTIVDHRLAHAKAVKDQTVAFERCHQHAASNGLRIRFNPDADLPGERYVLFDPKAKMGDDSNPKPGVPTY